MAVRAVVLDAIATAHTLDDQAETVLAKFLRGSVDRRLGGNSVQNSKARRGGIIRPLLAATRAEIEAYLRELGQDWREDSSNRNLTFTRNRIRHELLPLLEGWNPRLREHLAQMAELARDEEAWWQAELAPVAATDLAAGASGARGRARCRRGLDSGLAIEVSRLAALAPALQRRLMRYAAEQFGAALDFSATEAVRSLALGGRAGQKLALPQGLRAERTARELRLSFLTSGARSKGQKRGSCPGTRWRFPAKSTRPPSGFGSASNSRHQAAPKRNPEWRMAAAGEDGHSCATGSPATG
jgi:tRNA(Ile)-lysidine synthase